MKDVNAIKEQFRELIKELDSRGLSPEPAVAFSAALTMVVQVAGRAWAERLISSTLELNDALHGLPADAAKSLMTASAGAN